MKNKTRIFLPILFIFCCFGLRAQSPPDHDPTAKKILDAVSAKNKTYSSVRINFELLMDNKQDNIHESQEGTLLLKGNQYQLEMSGTELYCDGRTQWNHMVENEEVQIITPEYEEGELNPTNIFTIYEKGFKYQYVKEEVEGGVTLQLIKLFPEDADAKSYHTINLYVNKAKKQIHSIAIIGKEGDDFTYRIVKLTPNPATTPSDFIFNSAKYPDVEVIDLRD